MTRWYRYRIWVHRVLYQTDRLELHDHDLIMCDCGGHARLYRHQDGVLVCDVTCPVWGWADRVRRRSLPAVRLLP